MDESQNKGTAGEAIFGVILIFGILLLLIYKFGANHDTVSNEQLDNIDTKTQLLNALDSKDADSDIYNKYVKKIYESQSNGTNTNVDEIVLQYQQELESKVAIPTQNVTLQNVSSSFSPKLYAQNFEIMFEDLKKNGGTSEGNILLAQITSDNTLLPLSDYDRETILRIATEYDLFAGKMTRLSTPIALEKKAAEITKSALNISYILKQMVAENDQKIYSLWISKYAENISDIITLRYALQQ